MLAHITLICSYLLSINSDIRNKNIFQIYEFAFFIYTLLFFLHFYISGAFFLFSDNINYIGKKR